MATFKNCKIFSTYYFSYVRGYKAALRDGNQNIVSSIFYLVSCILAIKRKIKIGHAFTFNHFTKRRLLKR